MSMETYNALNERVKAAQETDRKRGDLQATSDLIDELAIKTIDGKTIRCGMRVVDYNLAWTSVTGIQSVAYADDGNHVIWFKTKTGMFDGQRLWARMP
jgi:hypothetical protein